MKVANWTGQVYGRNVLNQCGSGGRIKRCDMQIDVMRVAPGPTANQNATTTKFLEMEKSTDELNIGLI